MNTDSLDQEKKKSAFIRENPCPVSLLFSASLRALREAIFLRFSGIDLLFSFSLKRSDPRIPAARGCSSSEALILQRSAVGRRPSFVSGLPSAVGRRPSFVSGLPSAVGRRL